MQTQTKDPNLIIMVNDYKECYIFLYDQENYAEILKTLDRFASNPELSFSWHDSAVLGKNIRKKMQKLRQGDKKWDV